VETGGDKAINIAELELLYTSRYDLYRRNGAKRGIAVLAPTTLFTAQNLSSNMSVAS